MPAGVTADVKTYQLFINGEWAASSSSATIPVHDPASEEVIAQVPDANADDVNRAVAAAKAAFEDGPWATTTPQERGRVLFRLAEKIRQNTPTLAELECRNTGFMGRTGIYEMMKLSPRLRGLISAQLDLGGFAQAALSEGMRPLRISAADQVTAGLTTVQEILTVLPPIDAFDDTQP